MRRWVWVILGVAVVAGTTFGVVKWRLSYAKANQRYNGKTAAEWVEQLDATDATDSVEDLRSQGESALPVLLEARKSPNLRVHRRAIELLIGLGTPSVGPLVEALPHAGARVEVALVRLGSKAVPGLEKALSGKDGAAAARVLGLMGVRAVEAVPALVGLVQDGGADKATRVAAVDALARIGAELGPGVLTREDDPIVNTMAAALGSDDLRIQAARALSGFGPSSKSAIPDLVSLLKEPSPDLRIAVCQALGATLDPDAALPLLGQLRSKDQAAQAAAIALARLGPAARPALPALIAALTKDKQEVQFARPVLERLGETAVPSLREALESSDDGIRLGAAEVLGLLGPRAGGTAEALVARLEDKKPVVALEAAQALVRVDLSSASKAVGPLGKLLASEDKAVVAGAAFVLAELGSIARPLVPDLLTMLAGKDETRAAHAASLLGGIRPATKEVLAALEAGLKGPKLVRPVCVESLGRQGDASKGAIPALRKCLDDSTLRDTAALALVRISREESALVVEKLGPDIASREAPALAALAGMDPPPAEALPVLRKLLGDARLGSQSLFVLSRMDRVARAKAVPDLVTLLGSSNVPIQRRAADMLGDLSALAAPGLAQALKSPSTRTRVGAMTALRSDKFRTLVKDRTSLLDALEDTDIEVREQAGEALAVLGVSSEPNLQRVTELLDRPEADLRRFAVRILLAGLDKPDLPLDRRLEECLFDPDEGVRMNVCFSRVTTKSPSFGVVASDDPSYNVRMAADLAARKSHSFATRVESEESLQRLVRIGDPRWLLELVGTTDPKEDAIRKALPEPLGQMTRGVDLSNRISAFVALDRLRKQPGPASERFLQSILLGWDDSSRLEAINAVRQPSPASVAILTHRREVEWNPEIRAAIDRALTRRKR